MTQFALDTAVADRQGLPEAGTYEIDTSHSDVAFVARHLMVTKVRGHFESFSGTITVGETPEQSAVEVTIDPTSINTRDAKRDEHLRTADFFDTENHSAITFKSTAVDLGRNNRLRVTGDLTILGRTRSVVLDGSYDGAVTDPWGGSRIAFEARTEIDREDWGLTWNVALETGGVVLGRKIQLELTVEAVRA